MTTFTIDTENKITAFAAQEDALRHSAEGNFTSEKELARLAGEWPISRFAEVWNTFAGVVPFDQLKPVKKFTDRKTGVARIWKAVQALTPVPARYAANVAPKRAQTPTGATLKNEPPTPRDGSKKAIVLDLIRREAGATLQELMAATGWQAHSVRGFISGSLSRKMGIAVESFKQANGERAYRAPGIQNLT